ncbi:MAG: lipopolysaccharide assembly protein LapB [Gammaproteobacteria bacterium]
MWELLFLLLPIAALSGWIAGRRLSRPSSGDNGIKLSSEYFQGLNFLINDKPDRAIDAFIRMLDSTPDSVETTLALGNLFRKRGEVDRAIRLHQKLISQPLLTAQQRRQSVFELGQDYMRAGVYDRAESLFLELTNSVGDQLATSVKHLIDIYEREKDWDKAVKMSQKLQNMTGQFMGREIAHYRCEQAQVAWAKGSIRKALRYLKSSVTADKFCVRSSLIQGDIDRAQGRYRQALNAYQQVQHQDMAYISEAIQPVTECYVKMGAESQLINYFEQLLRISPNISVMLASVSHLKNYLGLSRTAEMLADYIYKHPSIQGLAQLIDLHVHQSEHLHRREWVVLKTLIERLLVKKPSYKCGHCGFAYKTLHWQCPSCRHWSTVKPILALETEL